MNTIYEIIQQKIAEGKPCLVNFEKRFIKIGANYIVVNGAKNKEWGIPEMTLEETLAEIERLYDRYKHSVPTERSESVRRRYFYALPLNELPEDDLLYGEKRDVAQAMLESFILISICNGNLKWDEEKMGKWFWHSANHEELIILRRWVE